MSSFSFGAFPNRLDQQLMVEIASLLLMAMETDAPMQNKGGAGGGLTEQQQLRSLQLVHTPSNLFLLDYLEIPFATVQ